MKRPTIINPAAGVQWYAAFATKQLDPRVQRSLCEIAQGGVRVDGNGDLVLGSLPTQIAGRSIGLSARRFQSYITILGQRQNVDLRDHIYSWGDALARRQNGLAVNAMIEALDDDEIAEMNQWFKALSLDHLPSALAEHGDYKRRFFLAYAVGSFIQDDGRIGDRLKDEGGQYGVEMLMKFVDCLGDVIVGVDKSAPLRVMALYSLTKLLTSELKYLVEPKALKPYAEKVVDAWQMSVHNVEYEQSVAALGRILIAWSDSVPPVSNLSEIVEKMIGETKGGYLEHTALYAYAAAVARCWVSPSPEAIAHITLLSRSEASPLLVMTARHFLMGINQD